jgi:hypothetical protein
MGMVELRDGVWETIGEYSFDDLPEITLMLDVSVKRLRDVPEIIRLDVDIRDRVVDERMFLARLMVHYPTGTVIDEYIPFFPYFPERRRIKELIWKLWSRITKIIDESGGDRK